MQTRNVLKDPRIANVELFDLEFYPYAHQDNSNLPLGKKMERAFSRSIDLSDRYDMLAEGIQISENKITLGELDFLIRDLENEEILHVELVYKFYLYIPWIGETELQKWIGPNFKDRLVYKMKKLREHQFPILYHGNVEPELRELGIDVNTVKQRLCFCAELFVPSVNTELKFEGIQENCIQGQWMHLDQFRGTNYSAVLIHVCAKWEWIVRPESIQGWLEKDAALAMIESELSKGRSPMVWLKSDRSYEKLFIIPNGQIKAA